MEFCAQELWIFLIYNVRGSVLSCLLRLTVPPPQAFVLFWPRPPWLAPPHLWGGGGGTRGHVQTGAPGSQFVAEMSVALPDGWPPSLCGSVPSLCSWIRSVLVPSSLPFLAAPVHGPCSLPSYPTPLPQLGSHRNKPSCLFHGVPGTSRCARASPRKTYKLALCSVKRRLSYLTEFFSNFLTTC